jgi:hypothetical protein
MLSRQGSFGRRVWCADEEGLDVNIYGRQWCRMVLSLNGKVLDFLPGEVLLSDWTLGKGIKQRFWTGKVEDWCFYRGKP